MKRKTIRLEQYLAHNNEDEEKAVEYMDQSLPLVGEVVFFFNSLEKMLDSLLCEIISDRTDEPGLIVIAGQSYGAKVELFQRLSDYMHSIYGSIPTSYERLTQELKRMGNLRNLVVHADWSSTDHEGFSFVRVKIQGGSMEQEYVQFSVDSLEKLTDELIETRDQLEAYWHDRHVLLARP